MAKNKDAKKDKTEQPVDPVQELVDAGAFVATAGTATQEIELESNMQAPLAEIKVESSSPDDDLSLKTEIKANPAALQDDAGKKQRFSLPLSFGKAFLLALAITLPAFILFNAPAAYKAFLSLLTMLRPFIIGAALAFLIKIPMNVVERLLQKLLPKRFKKLKRPLALLLTLAVIFIFLALCIRLIVPQVIQSVVTLEANSKTFALKLADYLERFEMTADYAAEIREFMQGFSWDSLIQNIGNYLKQGSTTVLKQAISTTSAIATGTTNGIFALFFMLYVLIGKERLSRQGRRLIYAYLPEKQADNTLYVGQLLHDNFAAFIGGQFMDALMIAAWSYLGVIIIGMPGLLIVPVIMGVTDLVPLIGPIVGTFLATLVVVIDSPLKALVLLIYLLIVQQIQGNVIYPKLVGDRLGLPAMWTLVAVSLGGSLLGIVGMWIFCPLFAVIYLLLDQDSQHKIEHKEIDLDHKDGPVLVAVRHSKIEDHPDYCEIETEVSQVSGLWGKIKAKSKKIFKH